MRKKRRREKRNNSTIAATGTIRLCCVPRRSDPCLPLGRSFVRNVVSLIAAFRHRFLEGTVTGDESDISSYARYQPHHISNDRATSSHSTSPWGDKPTIALWRLQAEDRIGVQHLGQLSSTDSRGGNDLRTASYGPSDFCSLCDFLSMRFRACRRCFLTHTSS